MQKWLNDNGILTSLHTRNEVKSIVTERFIRTLKGNMYQKIAANDSKSYLSYLNKFVEKYSNTYHRSIGKKPIDADYTALPEKT